MASASVPEVPADLWSRFARLAQACYIDITCEAKYGPAAGVQRSWRVVVHPPESAKPGVLPVSVYAASSAAAIAGAIGQAEERGWAAL